MIWELSKSKWYTDSLDLLYHELKLNRNMEKYKRLMDCNNVPIWSDKDLKYRKGDYLDISDLFKDKVNRRIHISHWAITELYDLTMRYLTTRNPNEYRIMHLLEQSEILKYIDRWEQIEKYIRDNSEVYFYSTNDILNNFTKEIMDKGIHNLTLIGFNELEIRAIANTYRKKLKSEGETISIYYYNETINGVTYVALAHKRIYSITDLDLYIKEYHKDKITEKVQNVKSYDYYIIARLNNFNNTYYRKLIGCKNVLFVR